MSLKIDNLTDDLQQAKNKILGQEKEIAALKKVSNEKPKKHRYSIDLIKNALDLHGIASLGYRTLKSKGLFLMEPARSIGPNIPHIFFGSVHHLERSDLKAKSLRKRHRNKERSFQIKREASSKKPQ